MGFVGINGIGKLIVLKVLVGKFKLNFGWFFVSGVLFKCYFLIVVMCELCFVWIGWFCYFNLGFVVVIFLGVVEIF